MTPLAPVSSVTPATTTTTAVTATGGTDVTVTVAWRPGQSLGATEVVLDGPAVTLDHGAYLEMIDAAIDRLTVYRRAYYGALLDDEGETVRA